MAVARASFLRLCCTQSLQRLSQCSLLPYRTSYNGSTTLTGGRSSPQKRRSQISPSSTILGGRHGTACFSYTPLPPSTPIELRHTFLPNNANQNGNVYGGTILDLIEQTGHSVANRHCDTHLVGGTPLTTAIARVDHVDFHQPIFIGEVAQLKAAVTYTSPQSVEVTVDVRAENVVGDRRHTNTATLWYVAIPADVEALRRGEGMKAVPVPQIEGLSEEEMAKGKKRYEAQKAARSARVKYNGFGRHQIHQPGTKIEDHTVLASQTTLVSMVFPSDCTITGHMMGGSLMKMMDSAAGICAARHYRCEHVVTACIDAIDFHGPIKIGEAVFVTARPVFTGTKSMEIEVTTEAESFEVGASFRRITNTAYFTYLVFGKDKHVKPVPPLKLESDEERQRFEEGRRRYEDRKKMRQEMAKLKQTS